MLLKQTSVDVLVERVVKYSFRDTSRSSSPPGLAALLTPSSKSFVNHCREYWYIGSTFDRFTMQKNSKDERNPTGL